MELLNCFRRHDGQVLHLHSVRGTRDHVPRLHPAALFPRQPATGKLTIIIKALALALLVLINKALQSVHWTDIDILLLCSCCVSLSFLFMCCVDESLNLLLLLLNI